MPDEPNLFNEKLIELREVPRLVPPRNSKPITLTCIWRWATKGIKGPDGRRVRLEGCRIGGRWYTTEESLARFSAALTPNFDDEPAPPPRTPGQRERASQRAAEALAKVGI